MSFLTSIHDDGVFDLEWHIGDGPSSYLTFELEDKVAKVVKLYAYGESCLDLEAAIHKQPNMDIHGRLLVHTYIVNFSQMDDYQEICKKHGLAHVLVDRKMAEVSVARQLHREWNHFEVRALQDWVAEIIAEKDTVSGIYPYDIAEMMWNPEGDEELEKIMDDYCGKKGEKSKRKKPDSFDIYLLIKWLIKSGRSTWERNYKGWHDNHLSYVKGFE